MPQGLGLQNKPQNVLQGLKPAVLTLVCFLFTHSAFHCVHSSWRGLPFKNQPIRKRRSLRWHGAYTISVPASLIFQVPSHCHVSGRKVNSFEFVWPSVLVTLTSLTPVCVCGLGNPPPPEPFPAMLGTFGAPERALRWEPGGRIRIDQ